MTHIWDSQVRSCPPVVQNTESACQAGCWQGRSCCSIVMPAFKIKRWHYPPQWHHPNQFASVTSYPCYATPPLGFFWFFYLFIFFWNGKMWSIIHERLPCVRWAAVLHCRTLGAVCERDPALTQCWKAWLIYCSDDTVALLSNHHAPELKRHGNNGKLMAVLLRHFAALTETGLFNLGLFYSLVDSIWIGTRMIFIKRNEESSSKAKHADKDK